MFTIFLVCLLHMYIVYTQYINYRTTGNVTYVCKHDYHTVSDVYMYLTHRPVFKS